MDKLDRLIMQALEAKEPRLKPWERSIKENPHTKECAADLIELLGFPRDDWRQIVQALALEGRRIRWPRSD